MKPVENSAFPSKMVTFSTYVSLAYEVAEEKGFRSQLRGVGSQQANQNLMSDLAYAYNENNHSEASRRSAKQYLKQNLRPP